MDISSLVDVTCLKLIAFLLIGIVPDISYATSIFEVILGIQPSLCSSFTVPKKQSIVDPKIIHPQEVSEQVNYEYTVSSPNFPLKYPTNIQCILLIKAPNFDYSIILEVRERFEIEPSKNCATDFLEIKDGPFGFSRKIGRYCSSEKPPKEIKSSGPFLWLRFRSDNNLVHNGFRIVYRFIRNVNIQTKLHYCYYQVMISPGNAFNLNTKLILTELQKSVRFQDNSSVPLECIFDFHVNPDFKTFTYKALFKRPTQPIPCTSNRLDIFHKGTFEDDVSNPSKRNYLQICEGSEFDQDLFKHTTRTTFRIIIQDLSKINNMSFIITSVKIVKDNCSLDYYLCSKTSKICVSRDLLCNNDVNCPEKTDENCFNGQILPPGQEITTSTTADPANIKKSSMKSEEDRILQETNKTHAIILGSIGSILVVSMVLCLLLTLHSKKKDKASRDLSMPHVTVPALEKCRNISSFYQSVQTSDSNVKLSSSEKLERRVVKEDPAWSKRPLGDVHSYSAHRINDGESKHNGDIKFTSVTNHKKKIDSIKSSSLSRIGKYLSVPYPVKSQSNSKSIIPNKRNHQIRCHTISTASEDFRSSSSRNLWKQNSSTIKSMHPLPRASSVGSGLRRHLQEPADDRSNNKEWCLDPVDAGINGDNSSSKILNSTLNTSVKSLEHLQGCRSLPNFNNVKAQNSAKCTNPNSNNIHYSEADLSECNDNNESRDEHKIRQNHVQNHRWNNNQSYKFVETKRRQPVGSKTRYGYAYICDHQPDGSNMYDEYIA